MRLLCIAASWITFRISESFLVAGRARRSSCSPALVGPSLALPPHAANVPRIRLRPTRLDGQDVLTPYLGFKAGRRWTWIGMPCGTYYSGATNSTPLLRVLVLTIDNFGGPKNTHTLTDIEKAPTDPINDP